MESLQMLIGIYKKSRFRCITAVKRGFAEVSEGSLGAFVS